MSESDDFKLVPVLLSSLAEGQTNSKEEGKVEDLCVLQAHE